MTTATIIEQTKLNNRVPATGHNKDTTNDKIAGVCSFTAVSDDHAQLLENLSQVLPGLPFRLALTRGGWHRIGGLLDSDGNRLSHSLTDWIEQHADGDITGLFAEYADAGYVVTYLHGKTHYLIAQTGYAPQDFIQLEIEEVQELTDHLLFNENEIPGDIDDLIEPVNTIAVSQQPVGKPCYNFRRMTNIAVYLLEMSAPKHKSNMFRRFIEDWNRSSAGECGLFSDHWVLGLQEYTDEYGEPIMLAKPVSTHTSIPRLEKEHISRGSRLANLIHGFDREVGYPMAWFFYMLTHRNVPYKLAEAIHDDQMGAYDYLSAKDLKVLIDWYNKPYSI